MTKLYHTCTLVAPLPSTSVEAEHPPPVTQSSVPAPPEEVRPPDAEGSAILELEAPLDDSLSWAERVEQEEAEIRAISPILPPKENPEDE